MRNCLRLICLAQILLWGCSSATAQTTTSPHAKIQPSLVFLKAVGANEENGNETTNYTTGFVSSKDGTVITNYHLLKDIGPKVRITAILGGKVGVERDASLVSANPINDLIRLQILNMAGITNLTPVNFVSPGELDTLKLSDQLTQNTIYTSGFSPAIPNAKIDHGTIQAFSGPAGYLWATSIRFSAGQSGSPVYLSDGRVIGIAKGSQGEDNFFIPINFATTLEPRLQALDRDTLEENIKRSTESAIKELGSRVQALGERLSKLDAVPNYKKMERDNYETDKFSLTRQILAQASCVAIAKRSSFIFAIPRECRDTETKTCATVCKEALKGSVEAKEGDESKLSCLDSLHVYGVPGGKAADKNEQLGLKTARFFGCKADACGPNFCCCAIAKDF